MQPQSVPTVSITGMWHGKPYYSLDAYCKNTFCHKCYKIALNAHMTCPNRDGTLGNRGCIFCSAGGSGEFAVPTEGLTVQEQLTAGLKRFGSKKVGDHYIAYYQAFTNTYASAEYLKKVYVPALKHPSILGISIATRPDCLPQEVLELISSLQKCYPDKFIWIELGLQTMHEDTARFLRRGYELSCFLDSLHRLKERSIPVIVHTILGLPGETEEDMFQTIRFVNECHPFGVKLQLLHVLKGTDLADIYEQGKFSLLSKEAYLDIVIHCLELLAPDIVIHRVTGDGPRQLTIAPLWSLNKKDVLNSLLSTMRTRGAYQGRLYISGGKYASGTINLI